MKKLILLFVAISLLSFSAKADQVTIDQLVRKLSNQNGVEKLHSLNRVSAMCMEMDQRAEASAYANKAMELAQSLNMPAEEAIALNNMGLVYESKYDYTNAMKSFVNSLKINNKLDNKEGIATSKNNIGRVFYRQEDVPSALENLNAALGLRNSIQDKEGAAETNKTLGDVYLLKGFFGKAKNHYVSSMNQYIELNKIGEAADLASHLGKIISGVGDYEGALVYYRMSLDFNRSLETVSKIAEDYNNIAMTHFAQGSYDEALENNDVAYDIRKSLDDKIAFAESAKNYGMIYAYMGNKAKANDFLAKAVKMVTEIGNEPGTQYIYKDVSETYHKLGSYDKAYKYQVAFADSRDFLFNKEKSTALLELTTKYQSEFQAEKKMQQIETLEKEKTYSAKIRYFLLGMLGLGLMLMMVLFNSYKRKQRDNQLLKNKNEEINRQKEEIDGQNAQLEEKNATLDNLNGKLVNEMAERESIEQSSFARDRFLATMSHEMRTPMNIIIGLTHLLLEENPREDQVEHLRTLQFSANNLVVFINDVLDFSKIEAGKLSLENREFRPMKIYEDTRRRFQLPADDKKLAFNYNFDKMIPEGFFGDPTRLNQIITNLVSNAIKYTEQGSVNVDVRLHELKGEDAMIKLVVSDTGPGIEQSALDEMFRKFSGNTMDIFEGYANSGLGLAITKRLVDLQNGKIEADSVIGKGTTFTVFMPYKVVELEANPEAKNAGDNKKTFDHLAGNKILLVEDNQINQLVVAKMLRKLGMDVITANNGLEALDCFEVAYFDLVLMDIQMPEMDGYRATAEIRKQTDPRKRDVPIIALTASAFLTEKEKAKLFGMNDHVGKPFGPEDLLDKMSNCLAAYRKAFQTKA